MFRVEVPAGLVGVLFGQATRSSTIVWALDKFVVKLAPMSALSAEVGTPSGFQFAAVSQSPSVLPLSNWIVAAVVLDATIKPTERRVARLVARAWISVVL